MRVQNTAKLLPLGAGLSYKPQHHSDWLKTQDVAFAEVHAENYMGAGGAPLAQLAAIRASVPLSVHGVGLSIGGAEALDLAHLKKLAQLAQRYNASEVSEHLAWSSHNGHYFGDLLPVAYDEQTLHRTIEHVQRAQECLGRRLLIENPSTYLPLAASVFDEVDFLRELSTRSGCALLLDINNVVVSCCNHGQSAMDYLQRFPLERVAQIHLAGHTKIQLSNGASLCIDDHGSAVEDQTWSHYEHVIARIGATPTLVEWDSDVPEFHTLLAQQNIAARKLAQH